MSRTSALALTLALASASPAAAAERETLDGGDLVGSTMVGSIGASGGMVLGLAVGYGVTHNFGRRSWKTDWDWMIGGAVVCGALGAGGAVSAFDAFDTRLGVPWWAPPLGALGAAGVGWLIGGAIDGLRGPSDYGFTASLTLLGMVGGAVGAYALTARRDGARGEVMMPLTLGGAF